MKTIEETHPSMKDMGIVPLHSKFTYIRGDDVQKHTIDKAVLKTKIYDETIFPMYDTNYRKHLCKILGLEEEQ